MILLASETFVFVTRNPESIYCRKTIGKTRDRIKITKRGKTMSFGNYKSKPAALFILLLLSITAWGPFSRGSRLKRDAEQAADRIDLFKKQKGKLPQSLSEIGVN